MKETMCGHLAIWEKPDPNQLFKYVLNVHGTEVVGAWGIVMNFLDWGELKDRSNIYQRFADCNFEFELTSIDGASTLAMSPNHELLTDENSIIVETETMHGVWQNRYVLSTALVYASFLLDL